MVIGLGFLDGQSDPFWGQRIGNEKEAVFFCKAGSASRRSNRFHKPAIQVKLIDKTS